MVGVETKKKVTYEDSRKKRVEENKKRMEELNLSKLVSSLRTPVTPIKPSPAKHRVIRRPVEPTVIRRSGRNADKPPRSYKEEPIEPLGRVRRGHSHKSGPRNTLSRASVAEEDRAYAEERADALQSKLEPEFPSFVKAMLHSHVIQGFWLGLPVDFCNAHLPKHDEQMTLFDEDGNETSAKYLADKRGLSGGWRGFALDHDIADGDACVFQLIKPTEFKVYIVRMYQNEDNDEDSELAQPEFSAKRVRRSLEEK